MRTTATELWWKHAVFYCLDVETFMDSDGDGIGDFRGLSQRVEYLCDLGVTAIWLLPFFPTCNRDDGYDVTDYYNVDPRLGSLGDVAEFLEVATERGLRVVMDLPFNHTSDQHPWFQRARADRDSPYHDYYVWADEEPDEPRDVVFPGEVEKPWTYDENVGRWYFHRFYEFQPELNIANPAVRREFEKIIGFWLKLGFSGFRLDALPFLLEQVGIAEPMADPHECIRELRAYAVRRRGDAMLLGEANVEAAELPKYFGAGDQMQMLYDYHACAGLYLALTRNEAAPIANALRELPQIPSVGQWLNFARLHDEVNFERLTDAERAEVFEGLAPKEEWRIYDRGLRRRLAPLLDGDRRRLLCTYSLVLSLPGTPCLYYGDELGMGDRLDLDGRLAVRTPMQWTSDATGGFSVAPAERLVRPLVEESGYDVRSVNAASQRADGDSLFSAVRRLVSARRECPELGWGRWEVMDVGTPAVLAHRAEWEGSAVVVLHNFTGEDQQVELELAEPLAEITADATYDEGQLPPSRPIRLRPYGFRWFRLQQRSLSQSAR